MNRGKSVKENQSNLPDPFRDDDGALDDATSGSDDLASALERSLNATLDHQKLDCHSPLRASLVRFARQFDRCELTLSPILVGLVAVATEEIRLPTSSFRDQMNLAVAETIFNDTSSRQRIEQLWHRLQREELS